MTQKGYNFKRRIFHAAVNADCLHGRLETRDARRPSLWARLRPISKPRTTLSGGEKPVEGERKEKYREGRKEEGIREDERSGGEREKGKTYV